MKNILFILIVTIAAISGVSAQGARQLYLGYENKEKLAAATGKSAPKTAAKTGRPGAKVVVELIRGGSLSTVSPLAVFRSGDKIRLRLATNFDGFLRLLSVGSSGKISLLFPYEGADDSVQPSENFQIPKGGDWILFDSTPGTETLTVIFSRNAFGAQSNDDLSRSAGKSRNLILQTDAAGTYAVSTETSVKKPVGFTLRLKHL